jgi:cytoskeletal protein CcmA (bactofilin family)
MLNSRKSDKDGLETISTAPQPPLPASAWQSGARPGERTAGSVIGADLTIIGNLVSRGLVHIDGEILGDIQAVNVVVGETARITGAIVAEDIVVHGHTMGSIRGNRVMLQSSCRVEGDVFHQALSIEQGAYFEGKSRRFDAPTAGVTQPGVPDLATRTSTTFGA